ncbi:MAG TPA: hypothetical protein VMW35_11050 [Myxococcota bacterium]|nr:hypothetical protein [Myxococcota bacterium]
MRPTATVREPVIDEAIVTPGHDGQAQLVVRVRYENGAVGSVTLDAAGARKLLEGCAVESAADLRGHSWRCLLDILPE